MDEVLLELSRQIAALRAAVDQSRPAPADETPLEARYRQIAMELIADMEAAVSELEDDITAQPPAQNEAWPLRRP